MKPVVRVVPLEEIGKAWESLRAEFPDYRIIWMRIPGDGSVALCAADSERAAKAALAKVEAGA